jgi:hypothetical protein
MTITATIAGAISMLAQLGMFFGGQWDNDGGLGVVGSLLMLVLAPDCRHDRTNGDQSDARSMPPTTLAVV